MLELRDLGGEGGRVIRGDSADVGEDVALEESALGAGRRDLGDLRGGNVVFMQELGDGGEEGLVLRLGLSRGMADAWRVLAACSMALGG